MIRVLFSLVLAITLATPFARALDKFDSEKAKFAIKVKNLVFNYEELGVFVLPGETLSIEALGGGGNDKYELKAQHGKISRPRATQWLWRAPQTKGRYRVKLENDTLDDSITLNVFVMVPFHHVRGGKLNGYAIGEYSSRPLKNHPIYQKPGGFIEVTEENKDTRLSPHFKLKQFVTKQAADYPKYVILDERLLLKLELILERANQLGYFSNDLYIMSGYRTPYYNRAIGNVRFSLHQFGKAADIFIDDDDNGLMDDLNRNGRVDKGDAVVLYKLIQNLFKDPPLKPLQGGVGLYGSTAAHGPFVHVDVRGYPAKWG